MFQQMDRLLHRVNVRFAVDRTTIVCALSNLEVGESRIATIFILVAPDHRSRAKELNLADKHHETWELRYLQEVSAVPVQ